MKQITNIQSYIIDLLDRGIVPFYAKKITGVLALPGKVGEQIVTVTSTGLIETVNTVSRDEKTGVPEWVVTGKNGEQYIIRDRSFRERYLPDPDEEGRFLPKGEPVIVVPVDEDIIFLTSWGEMIVEAGGFLVVNEDGGIHGIQKFDFEETYQVIDLKEDPVAALRELIRTKGGSNE
ncbi:MAG: hypothetical protein IJ744_05095 [Lachnospiraceae bacterium]|nr:hypothetical protein [Lachnospiraceae bacterium]